ncbi:MAG: 5-(carboxyamino)imidazole ribonucleotide synthase [Methylacidiphilales bacterium]|nr:5-(carboxyamino)imidazole ribonucleotide synthase [Candidatus Methylacidiphilales bacterium]
MRKKKIGIFGCGQLARMLSLYGAHLGIEFLIYKHANIHEPPKIFGQIFNQTKNIKKDISTFCKLCDVVTFEHEHLTKEELHYFRMQKNVVPKLTYLELFQDRFLEKNFLNSLGIQTAPYKIINSKNSLLHTASEFGFNCILKKRIGGYDGKFQFHITSESDCMRHFSLIDNNDWIIEKFIPFKRELSIISVASETGKTKIHFYPMTLNEHQGGMLKSSEVVHTYRFEKQAKAIAKKIVRAFNYVGVLCVEFFELKDRLIVNEIAPRVHNTGHWSIEGASINQFEAHIRAIANIPIGKITLTKKYIKIYNLIGSIRNQNLIYPLPDVQIHDYNKSFRPRRKVGHITNATLVLSDFKKNDAIIKTIDL